MNETTKQIVIAGVSAAVAAAAAAIVTNWLTKQSIASGSTPLPAGSTPTTTSGVIVATPKSLDTTVATGSAISTPPADETPPEITPQQIESALQVVQAVNESHAMADSQATSDWMPKNVSP